MRNLFILVFCFLVMISCTNKVILDTRSLEELQRSSLPSLPPSPSGPVEGEENVYHDTFYTGKTDVQPQSVDYLFIMDNSCSFGSVATKVKQALIDIPLESYSRDSVMGVMSSMVSKYPYSTQIHAGIRGYSGIEKEPGFLDLVDGLSISQFKSQVPAEANSYPMAGCQNKWFAPGARNSAGNYCFEAAMQNPYDCTRCEPGIHALEQALKKHTAGFKNMFRPGSYVHVINVTDEVYPGCNNTELTNNTPTAAGLKQLAMANTNISGFKIHGIGRGTVDKAIVEDSLGVYLPVSEYSYAPVIEKMMDSGVIEKPVFKLRGVPKKVFFVTIDGQETTDYKVVGDVLEMTNLTASEMHDIGIRYEL